jgi:hypothetical protein
MTALTAIACGIALGTLLVVLGAWWRLRRVRPKQRTFAKPASGLKLPSADPWDDDEPTTFHRRGEP